MAETVKLVDLDIDQAELLKKITKLQQKITDLKDDTKTLTKANKDLEAGGKKNTAQYKANAAQIEKNKVQTKGLSTEYRNNQNVLVALNSTENKQLGTLQQLEFSNKKLREEAKRLDLTRKSGQDRLTQVNKQLDQNNKTILENADATKAQKMNIGNYGSALQGLPGPLGGAVSGIQRMTIAAKAFIATPLGIILAAIALAIKVLSDAIKSNQALMDGFEAAGAGLSATYAVLTDRINNVIDAIVRLNEKITVNEKLNKIITTVLKFNKLVIGHLIPGLNLARKAFKDMGEEMEEEGRLARELTADLQALEDQIIGQIVQRAELQKIVQMNRLAVKDENLTNRERLDLLDEAIEAEEKLIALELSEAEERARILSEQVGLGRSLREELKAEQEALAKVIQVETDGAKRKIRLASERLTLARMVAKEDLEIAEQEALAAAKAVDNLISLETIKSVAINEIRDEDAEKQKERLDNITKLNETAAEHELTLADLTAEHKLALAQGFAGNIAVIFGKNTAIGKAAAIAETAINTYRGATAAYASLAGVPVVGPVLGAAAAAAAVVSGLVNVKKIIGIKSGLPGDSGAGASGISAGGITTPRGTFQIGQVISDGGLATQGLVNGTALSIREEFIAALKEVPPILVVEEVTVKQSSKRAISQVTTV